MPNLRRFRLTPGRLLVVLLVVEALLWLCDWFRWLPKGYGVLAAVAAVVVFFTVMLGWFLLALVFRWRFQYSLLSLLVLMVAVAVPFAWLAAEMKTAREQQTAAEAIVKAGGLVWYADGSRVCATGKSPPPSTLCRLLGGDLFVSVNCVDFTITRSRIADAELKHVAALPHLELLRLDHANVSDAGLKSLKGLYELQYLFLGGTNVSDVGMTHLKELTTLIYLDVRGTAVSETGVKDLHRTLARTVILR